jgi:hypothetical protein
LKFKGKNKKMMVCGMEVKWMEGELRSNKKGDEWVKYGKFYMYTTSLIGPIKHEEKWWYGSTTISENETWKYETLFQYFECCS